MKPSDLRMLLNDPEVQNIVLWKRVGLELDLTKSCLDRIGMDNRDTDTCIQEMLQIWLLRANDPTLEDLHEAIKTIRDRNARKGTMVQAKNDGKRIQDAIQVLAESIDKCESRDMPKLKGILQSDLKNLEHKLKGSFHISSPKFRT